MVTCMGRGLVLGSAAPSKCGVPVLPNFYGFLVFMCNPHQGVACILESASQQSRVPALPNDTHDYGITLFDIARILGSNIKKFAACA